MTQNAISYLDTRNRFWKQQIPHHIRERSTAVGARSKRSERFKVGPPPTQAMYKFVIKEMIRINNSELRKSRKFQQINNLFPCIQC